MKIQFTQYAFNKINQYIQHADGEISGIGQSIYDKENGIIIVKDVFIWEQECSAADTEPLTHDTVFDLVGELQGKGVPLSELNVWWHSHADMEAFFSGTDTTTIDNWVNDSFLVSVVGNKKGSFKGRVDIKNPIPCTIDNVAIETIVELDTENFSQIQMLEEQVDNDENFLKNLYAWLHMKMVDIVQDEVKEKVTVKNIGFKSTYNTTSAWNKKTDIQMEYAGYCGCSVCLEFIGGKTKSFNYAKHTWDNVAKMYYNPEEEGDWYDRNLHGEEEKGIIKV